MVNNQVPPLPETVRQPDHSLPQGKELEIYINARFSQSNKVANAVGVTLYDLRFRIYNQRIMWRLILNFDPKLTNDEVRRIAWDVAVKGMGAYEPQFFKGDEPNKPHQVVATWFTDGADYVKSFMQF